MKNIFICLFLPAFIHAQKPLSVGDKLPDHIVRSLAFNFQPSTGNKLIILDFFATWCTACVRELPKLDSLQKIFGTHFRVILITSQSKEIIAAFKKKNKTFSSVSFPVITGDTVFKKLFPHKYIPHEVWINEYGKIMAVTDPLGVNHENIRAFLSGKDPVLPLKMDAMDFDREKPLLLEPMAASF